MLSANSGRDTFKLPGMTVACPSSTTASSYSRFASRSFTACPSAAPGTIAVRLNGVDEAIREKLLVRVAMAVCT